MLRQSFSQTGELANGQIRQLGRARRRKSVVEIRNQCLAVRTRREILRQTRQHFGPDAVRQKVWQSSDDCLEICRLVTCTTALELAANDVEPTMEQATRT